MNPFRILSAIVFAMIVTLPIPAKANRILDCLAIVSPKYRLIRDEKRVHPAITQPWIRRWLALKAWKSGNDWKKREGDRVPFRGDEYEVIARLGRGGDGEVYIVQTPDGLRTYKNFGNAPTYGTNIPESQRIPHFVETLTLRAQEEGLPAPKIDGVDLENKAVLYEYLDALPIDVIKKQGEKLGIPATLVQSASHGDHLVADANCVYSFKYGQRYLIDPF